MWDVRVQCPYSCNSCRRLQKKSIIDNETSNIVSWLSLVPETSHRYFVAGADDGIKVYDLFNEKVVACTIEEKLEAD